jgi:lipopolysaccharide export system protein LptA
MTRRFSISGWLTGGVLMLACAAAVAAQPAKQGEQAQQPSGAMQGFSANRDQPVKITSNSLEVRDKMHQATFSGDVKLVQGDTTITCRSLTVFYEESQPTKKGGAPDVQGQPGQKQQNTQIKRAEAKGDVLIVQKDQSATGDNGVYDLKSNTMTLTGNVVVTQGTSVMRGERMVVNMATGVTKVDGTRQIELLMVPGASKDGKSAPATPPAANSQPPAPGTKSAPKGPIRIN